MKKSALFAALLLAGLAHAQTLPTLRIGLAEDPDVLDPTLARSFVGRVVFSALCDKLFDIDEKLNILPQLAEKYEWSADSKALTIKVRPGVTFVPTPRNWGGAPRERRSSEDSSTPRSAESPRASAPAAAAPAKSGGFVGWLKSLFGGSPAPEAAATESSPGEPRREGGGQRRHRGGRNRGGQGGGGGGRGRGGRGRSGGGRDERGSSQGGI